MTCPIVLKHPKYGARKSQRLHCAPELQAGHVGRDHTWHGQQGSSSQEDQAKIPYVGPEAEDQEANSRQPG